MNPLPISKGLETAARWSAIALCFAIPVSTPATSILLVLAVVFATLSKDCLKRYTEILSRQPAQIFLALYVMMLLAATYGMGTTDENLNYLRKYLGLLLLLPLMTIFPDVRSLRLALTSFGAALVLTLILSYLFWLSILPAPWTVAGHVFDTSPDNPIVFKLHITHGFFMAFGVFLFAIAAMQAKQRSVQRSLWLITLLAAFNVLFMVKGRTGYVVIMLLAVYLFHFRFGRKGLLIGAVAVLVLAGAGYELSSGLHQRIDTGITEAEHWQSGKERVDSIGTRLDFYYTTLKIIRQHPLLGVGIGGFPAAYEEMVKGTPVIPTTNPHNQYLLIAAQTGLVGLALLLALHVIIWVKAAKLSPPYNLIARGLIIAYVVGNLFNSFLLDFSERILFVVLCAALFGPLMTRSNANVSSVLSASP